MSTFTQSITRKTEDGSSTKVEQYEIEELSSLRLEHDYLITTFRPEIPPGRTEIDINLGDIGNPNDLFIGFTSSGRISNFVNSLQGVYSFGYEDILYKGRILTRPLFFRARESYLLCQKFGLSYFGNNMAYEGADSDTDGYTGMVFNGWPYTYENLIDPPPENHLIGMFGSQGHRSNGNHRLLFIDSYDDNFWPSSGPGIYIESAWLVQNSLDTILRVAFQNLKTQTVQSQDIDLLIALVN